MKIVLAQQNYHIGNFQSNLEKISAAIEKANEQKADLIVFSELSICGYPPADFLEFDEFITDCENAIQEICKQTRDIGVLIGAPTRNDIKKGKNLFNSALLLYQG
ncbi:MAG TPA: nitrilase-related carbon-nitrogen hydrolase, partial [Parasegetibacter sp.]